VRFSGEIHVMEHKGRLRAVDGGVLLVFVFEAPSLLFSQYCANSLGTSEAIAVAVLVYFVIRLVISGPRETVWLVGLLGIGNAWLAFSGVNEFAAGTASLTEIGLTDFVAFRTRFIHPIHGWLPGETFTAFLLTLPFACATAAYFWKQQKQGLAAIALLPSALIAGVLCLSLSRAVFWSTVLFSFAGCMLLVVYRVVTLRAGSFLLAGALGVIIAILACESALYPGIFQAYAGSHTSQARSTQGRMGIWSRSLELVNGHRWWGVGSSNAALSLLSSADQDETTGFASRAFSLPIQVLVEKGIIGFALYVTFLMLVGREFHRGMRTSLTAIQPSAETPSRRRGAARKQERLRVQDEHAQRAMKCCFVAGMVAVLFRELTYSSLLEHTLTLVLFFALAALVCAGDSP